MAANSPRKNGRSGPAPISALPLPADDQASGENPQPSLPLGSSGELTPAQRARLGLDVYGEDAAPAAPAPASGQSPPSDFGFAEMDPSAGRQQAPTAQSEPRLAAVRDQSALTPLGGEPRLAPAAPVSPQTPARPTHNDDDPAPAQQSREEAPTQTVSERDGIAAVERDRSVLGYGVAWTAFCICVTIAVSLSNATANPDLGPAPGMFAPALLSIGLGWVVVLAGRTMKNWRLLMIVPAVVLLIGPFVYTNWRLSQLEDAARGYLSSLGSSTVIDMDASTILSGTVNTDQGCFALTKDRVSGNVRVDVVSYSPATAQQQATMALAPRFARRVPAGGERAVARSYTMVNGGVPVVPVVLSSPAIDCAGAGAP